MESIFSITLNPALDLGGTVDQLVPDEKNYVKNEKRFPGGNGVNASRIIDRLGGNVLSTGFLGGSIGDEIKNLLNLEGLKHQFIKIAGSTRISVTVSDIKANKQTRLSFPGPKILNAEWNKLLMFLETIPEESLVIIGGSLPKEFDLRLLLDLIKKLSQLEVRCIVDFPSKVLKTTCREEGALLIKPNLLEFQGLVGKEVSRLNDVIREAKQLLTKVPLICVSSVEEGAVLVSPMGVWFGQIPDVKILTTVGAGDSMVGAMSLQLSSLKGRQNMTYTDLGTQYGDKVLRWGLAAACATLVVEGTQLGSAEDMKKFYREIKIQKIDL